MEEFDVKTIMIVCLSVFLAIVSFMFGFVSQELDNVKEQCGECYAKISR